MHTLISNYRRFLGMSLGYGVWGLTGVMVCRDPDGYNNEQQESEPTTDIAPSSYLHVSTPSVFESVQLRVRGNGWLGSTSGWTVGDYSLTRAYWRGRNGVTPTGRSLGVATA